MTDRDPFGFQERLLQRMRQILDAVEAGEYEIREELAVWTAIGKVLRDFNALNEGEDTANAGSEIRKFQSQFAKPEPGKADDPGGGARSSKPYTIAATPKRAWRSDEPANDNGPGDERG